MSRGVNGTGVALADSNGAIVRYFSPQLAAPIGIVAKTVTFPRWSILSMFWLQYSVAITSVFEAATPIGAGTMAKGVGLAAGSAGAISRSLTGARIVAKACGLAA
jgi:hypothetical protein